MHQEPDPRIYLAAERTALAWNRSTLALMAFGFVVERAGVLSELIGVAHGSNTAVLTALFGLAAVVLSAWVSAYSALRGRRMLEALAFHAPPEALPPRRLAALGLATAGLGALLAIWQVAELVLRIFGGSGSVAGVG